MGRWAMFIWVGRCLSGIGITTPAALSVFNKQFESLLLALTAIEHQYSNLPIHQKMLN